jgi:predicted ATP-binding protein involved in virulence
MSTLADYNPLASIKLPGAVIENPSGLIIVIGPNSSGKTLFLRDIQEYLMTGNQKFIVCENVGARKPANIQTFLQDLRRVNAIREAQSPPNHYVVYLNFRKFF